MKLDCKTCEQGIMVKTTASTGNIVGLILALIVLITGITLTVTGVGAIVGVPLILISLFMGGKRRKVWKCKTCKAVIDRA